MVATPPFSLSTATPGDSDIVSQFPGNERTLRDIIQQWILANHDANGNHPLIVQPWQSGTPSTPAASLNVLYADARGRLKYVMPDGTVNFVGPPPASVFYTASSSTPVGYLVADGSAVSRATYADLFSQISTNYGVGDGSTTFNLPDIIGRVIFGEDNSSTRLDITSFGNTPVLRATGGLKNLTLVPANLPPYTPAGTLSLTKGTLGGTVSGTFMVSTGGSQGGSGFFSFVSNPALTITGAPDGTFAGTPAPGQISTPFSRIPPAIILRALIKT